MAKGIGGKYMTRKTIFILVSTLLVVLLATALLAGCSSNELTSPRDLKVEDGKFSWSTVSGADGYMLYFNEDVNNRFFTWTNSLDVDNENIQTSLISGKTNFLWVRAVKLDKYGEPNVLSDRSRLDFNYSRQLEQISRITAKDNSTIEFRSVEGATSYVALVKTDGGETKEYEITYRVATTGLVGTIKGLRKGTYTVSVVAKSEGYKDSEPSKEVTFVQVNDDENAEAVSGWTVTFDLNYEDSTPITATAENNRSVAKPKDPERKGFTFKGWYFDSYCLIEAGFTSKNSRFNITANTTLYAKWEEDAPVVIETTSIYAYFADWTKVSALIYENETALFEGDGLVMTAIDGNAGWFTAKVDNRTTKIVFSNGTDQTQEFAFDKSKPYYANGEFTATKPEIDPDIPDSGYYIYVNGVKHNLAKNDTPDTTDGKLAEYIINLSLNKNDSVEIKDSDNNPYTNYEQGCNFNGSALVDGEYTFYLKLYEDGHAIWVEAPKTDDPTDYGVNVTVNEATTIQLENNPSPDDANVVFEFFGTFDLTVGDSIKVEGSDGFEFINYEPECGFTGVATVTGSYTIYVKKYLDGGDSIWMVVPENTGGDEGETITLYYYNIANWTNLKAYAWSGSVNNGAWPGVAMTAVDGHENWYQVEIPITFGNIIFNGSGGQTTDLLVDRSNVYYNGMEWTNDFKLYEGKTTRTVYFYNDQGWANVSCYAWTGTVNNGAWPGVAMTAVQGHAGWYKIEISISFVKIIFNNGSGGTGNQTDDIDIPTGDEIYYNGGWVESFN